MASSASSIATRQFITAAQAFQTKQIVDELVEEKLGNTQQINDLLLSNKQLNNILEELKGEHQGIGIDIETNKGEHFEIFAELETNKGEHLEIFAELEKNRKEHFQLTNLLNELSGKHDALSLEFGNHNHSGEDITLGSLQVHGDTKLHSKVIFGESGVTATASNGTLQFNNGDKEDKAIISATFQGCLNGCVNGPVHGGLHVGSSHFDSDHYPNNEFFIVNPSTKGSLDNIDIGANKQAEGHFTTVSADTLNVTNVVVGESTVTGNHTVTGESTVTGNYTVGGNHTVGGSLVLNGNIKVGDEITVTSNGDTLQFKNSDDSKAVISATFQGCLNGSFNGPMNGSLLVGEAHENMLDENGDYSFSDVPPAFCVMPHDAGYLDNVIIGDRKPVEGHFTTVECEDIYIGNSTHENLTVTGDLHFGGEYNLTEELNKIIDAINTLYGAIGPDGVISTTPTGPYGPYPYPYGPYPASVYPYGPYSTGAYPKLPKL